MATAEDFLSALNRRAKMLAPSAIATFDTNRDLCSWLLDPLARWAQAAYGERIFDEAALGYAKYCLGVAKAQQIYERSGKYTPEAMPEIVSGVYEDESYMVPYMWAAILIYAFLALDDRTSVAVSRSIPAALACECRSPRASFGTRGPQPSCRRRAQ